VCGVRKKGNARMKFNRKHFVKEQAFQAEQIGEIELSAAELASVAGGGACPESNGFPYGVDPCSQGYGYNYGGNSYPQGYGYNYGISSCHHRHRYNYASSPYAQGYGYNSGGYAGQGYSCYQSTSTMILSLPSACSY
jgi:hypothetical protein